MGNCVKPTAKKIEKAPSRSSSIDKSLVSPSHRRFKSELSLSPKKADVTTQLRRQPTRYSVQTPILNSYDAPNALVSVRSPNASEVLEIKSTLRSFSIFNVVEDSDLDEVIKKLKHFSLGSREVVCLQGHPGEYFFIVESGTVEIIIDNECKARIDKGGGFGELALLYDSERMATVKTIGSTTLWGIDRATFRGVLKTITNKNHEQNRKVIESIPIFQKLNAAQKTKLLETIIEQDIPNGKTVVREGEDGKHLYFVKEGEFKVTKRGEVIRVLGPGDYFGEQALIHNTKRTATITSVGHSIVFSIGREEIAQALGETLETVIYRNSIKMGMENSPVLSRLTSLQVESVIQRMQIASFKAGEVIFHKDPTRNQHIWLVLKGSLQYGDIEIPELGCIGDQELVKPFNYRHSNKLSSIDASTVAYISIEDLERQIGGTLQHVFSLNSAISVLKTMQILKSLSSSTLERIASLLKLQEFKKGDIIFNQNDPGTAFYIVKEGQVDIVINGSHIRTLGKNSYFGERSIILNEKRTATVIASSNVKLWVLSRSHFLFLVEEGIRRQVLQRMEMQNHEIQLSQLHFLKVIDDNKIASIYLTLDPQKKTLYALRTIEKIDISSLNLHSALEQERQLLLQVDHPFMLKLVKTFKNSECIFFLTEYVNGVGMRKMMEHKGPLSDQEAGFYAGCLSYLLKHLHEHHIVHRNLNPDAIMIDSEGYPKLLHFKTAKLVKETTNTIIGTPHYMAPEVILGKDYSYECDLWSLGVIIFELITGRLPFGEEENDPIEIYDNVVNNPIRYPPEIDNHEKRKNLCNLLLNKEPSLRRIEINNHPWFAGLNWDKLIGKLLQPPFLPCVKNWEFDIDVSARRGTKFENFLFSKHADSSEWNRRNRIYDEPEGWDANF